MKKPSRQLSTSRNPLFTEREGRTFALTMSGGFLFVAAVAYLRHNEVASVAALAAAVVAALAGVLVPGRLQGASRAWSRLGEAIGIVTTPLLMTIVYYLIVTPVGVLRRATRSRAVRKSSYWNRRLPAPPARAMERQF